MASQTVSGLAVGLREAVNPELLDSVYKNNDMASLLVSKDATGQGSYDVPVTVTSTTAAVVAEGAALPPITASAQQEGQFAPVEYHAVYGLSGAALRAMGNNYSNTLNGENIEFEDAFKQCIDLLNTSIMADATTGILGQIDDDTTAWGGVSRATYTTLKSHVVAGGSAAMTEAMINNLYYGMQIPPFSGRPELIISSILQKRRYVEAVVANATVYGGGLGDAGFSQVSFANTPWIGVPDFPTDEVIAVTGLVNGSGMKLINFETRYSDPEVQRIQLGPSCNVGMSKMSLANVKHEKLYDLCIAASLVVLMPWKQGKIEALATSW